MRYEFLNTDKCSSSMEFIEGKAVHREKSTRKKGQM